jgi:hypothetical protein
MAAALDNMTPVLAKKGSPFITRTKLIDDALKQI